MQTRNTIQCALVLEAVNELRCHATADEVYDAIAARNPTISRGTVYRNLNRLAQTGQIKKVSIPDGADRFDHRRDEHYHARCQSCGRVFDVDMEYFSDLEKRVKDTHGFRFTGHDIIFKGVCPDCGQQPFAAARHKSAHAGAKENP